MAFGLWRVPFVPWPSGRCSSPNAPTESDRRKARVKGGWERRVSGVQVVQAVQAVQVVQVVQARRGASREC